MRRKYNFNANWFNDSLKFEDAKDDEFDEGITTKVGKRMF